MLEELWYDIRYASRVLRRSPLNTTIAVAILALGIGANTAMFSAVNQVLLRPLPFSDPDHLVRVRDRVTDAGGQVHAFNMPARHIIALRDQATVFDGIVAASGGSMLLEGADIPERVSVVDVSDTGNTLGITPIAGRDFSIAERRQGFASAVTIVSHAIWQARFGGRADAIGATVRLDGRPFTVIGVMPPQYAFPYEAQFWMPIVLDPSDLNRDFAVFARRRAGAGLAQVRDALDAVAANVRRESVDAAPTFGFELMTIRENLLANEDAPLRALTYVVALLLLVGCVNVATLLLARATTRRREFAIRAALGAGRGRHVRQLLAESLLLAAFGCAGGLLLAAWIEPLTATLFPHVLRGQLGIVSPQIDWRVLSFAIAASVGSAVMAGVLPALGSRRAEPSLALVDGGRAFTSGPRRRRLLGTLIVAETALTLVLLAGAGLVIRNFVRLQEAPLGFRAGGLLAMEVTFPSAAYATPAARIGAVARIAESVRSLPGVQAAAVTTVNPLGGGTWGASVITEEAAAQDPHASINVNHRLITPALFEVMGIPIVQGRAFGEDDRATTAPVAIVSERLAARAWPNDNAIGKRIRLARNGAPWLTVVGVAGNVSDAHDPGVPIETWYLPFAQHAEASDAEHIYVMARAGGGDPLALVSAVQRAVVAVDRTLVPYAPVAMDRFHDASIARERVGAALMSGFGVFGLMLAALGVYGVMAFSVSQRTAEIGIRMALGAAAGDILPLVLRRALWLVGGGVALGAFGAIVLNRLLATLLTEVGRIDPAVLAAAAALIVAAAVAACVIPAIGAARLDPVAALRSE
ncbi:MAG TPA: ABC transporter permease [Vicinamibacterales bacterium]